MADRMLVPCLLTFILVGSIEGKLDFHSQLTPEELHTYFGVQTKEHVPSYDVVSPVHVEGSPQRPSPLSPKRPLKYTLTAFGENFTLHLNHNDQLIAPGCLVHHLQTNGSRKVRSCPTQADDCYYQGSSLDHEGSAVSLSTCNGLHGLIQLPDRGEALWIQPVTGRHVHRARRGSGSTGPLPHPHIVYRRAATHRHCAAEGIPEVRSLVSDAILASSRRRRAVEGGERYAEMLLVADPTMHRQYGDDLRHYLLTVANVAARVLLDSSLGIPVHFTVVKIQILEADQPGLVIKEDTDSTLESFCQWQERFNPRDDSNPQHHDGAALFTKLDLVHRGVQSTTGLATVGGMCGDSTRCSVNEDSGLSVGLTLAHETGHTLGMDHDGSGNDCENGKYVMSSNGGGGPTAMSWSSCSGQALTNYLASSKADCLKDRPTSPLELPRDLPGVIYDGDEQCQMYAGQGSSVCLGTTMAHGDECRHLVCFDPNNAGTCIADSVPRMDGTMCGDRKYCMHGQCVDIGPNGPQPIHGGWSTWETRWSDCSRSCGGGVRVRRRKCDNPKPRLGGHQCEGSDIIAEMCNMKDCGSSDKEYREVQCASTDSTPYNGQTYHWVPVNTMGDHECRLQCQIQGQRTVLLRSTTGGNSHNWYHEGTSCSLTGQGSFGRCVDGKCREFGCDGKTPSSYQFDNCGVCGGAGTTCRKQSGTYTRGRKHEYVTFVTIPKGSTSVKLTNKNRFTHMSLKVGGRRVLNEAGANPDSSGVYAANGLTVHYRSGSSGEETITVPHPLPEDAEAQVWQKFAETEFQGVTPQINYEYFVPTLIPPPPPEYVWRTATGECDKPCGGGVYSQVISCVRRSSGAQVDDHFCELRLKPSLTGAACNNQPCPPRWRAGPYGPCSQTCGGGGRQTRPVDCVQQQGGGEVVVTSDLCPAHLRPQEGQACNVGVACPAVWRAGDWSACSLTCGKGTRTRAVQCVSDDDVQQDVDASQCPGGSKPDVTEACVNAICSPEITGAACKDVDGSCAGYALTMCKEYGDWARQNCNKQCAYCSPDGGTACEDKSGDCAGYGQSICTGQYAAWATDNCARFCGHCGDSSSATGQGQVSVTCADKINNCAGYGQSVCTGTYAAWASDNCPKFCNLCQHRRRRSVLEPPPPPPPPPPSCGRVLTGLSGSLSLIGQPLDTPCTHVIAASPGFVLRLSFTALLIDCQQGDWLAVTEAVGSKKLKAKKQQTDLCRRSGPSGQPVQLTSRGHVVTVELRAALPGHGYNLTYTALPSPPHASGCDQLLTERTGAVVSPGFPATAQHNTSTLTSSSTDQGQPCVSTIVAPPRFSVRLHFDAFRVGEGQGGECDKDAVTLYDSLFDTHDVFCGTRRDLAWQSKGNQVKVVFARSQGSKDTGFMASYQFIAP